MNTQLFAFFLTDWQLASAGLHSDLVTVDADWHRLNLLTGSRHTSPYTQTQSWNWLRQQPHSTQAAHCLQKVQCWLPCINNSRTAASSAAVSWRHHMHKKCYLRDFKKLHYQNSIDIPMQTSKALLLQTQKYQRMHISFRSSNMPKDGRERYVLFFKITSEIKKYW